MRAVIAVAAICVASSVLVAQETSKPVPKDSLRVFVTGCTKGSVFTAGPRTEDPPSNAEIREGMHLRMNGPKKLMAELKAHEGSVVGVTGLMKKGQYGPGGVSIGGVRIGPAVPPGSSRGIVGDPGLEQAFIDVESWRPMPGRCPSK
jgi:hypothetical protein